jgi:hypothetical protein
MSTQGSGRRCVFCGAKVESKEHAMPTWVRDLIAEGDEPFIHREVENATQQEIRGWAADGPDFKVRRVCQNHCNGGWMSELETAVQPYIAGLIKGHGRTLYRDGQQLVAFWALKTAMMWQYASRSQPIPPNELHALYERRGTRTPPPGWQVWIAATNGAGAAYHCPARIKLDLPNGRDARAYASTFGIGHLALQVFGHELGERRATRDIGPPLGDALLRIWPYVGPVSLPPDYVLDLGGLEEAARAFVTSPKRAD